MKARQLERERHEVVLDVPRAAGAHDRVHGPLVHRPAESDGRDRRPLGRVAGCGKRERSVSACQWSSGAPQCSGGRGAAMWRAVLGGGGRPNALATVFRAESSSRYTSCPPLFESKQRACSTAQHSSTVVARQHQAMIMIHVRLSRHSASAAPRIAHSQQRTRAQAAN